MAFRNRLNPLAPVQNSLKLGAGESGCCDDNAAICKYVVDAILITTEIVSVTFTNTKGEEIVAPLAVPAEMIEVGDVVTGITNALIGEGLYLDTHVPHINAFVVEGAPDTGTIEIFSAAPITNIQTTVGANVPDVHCTQEIACRYMFPLPVDAAAAFTLDDYVLNDPHTVTGLDTTTGAAANGAVAVAAQTALADMYPDDLKRVYVKYDAVALEHKINFWLFTNSNQPNVAIGAGDPTAVERFECNPDYITEP